MSKSFQSGHATRCNPFIESGDAPPPVVCAGTAAHVTHEHDAQRK